MSNPSILVRRLDSNHDPIYGNGVADFLTDIDAVAQIIDTSLLLLKGEWWNNLAIGLPLFQSIIGVGGIGNNPEVAAMLIQQVINSVPFVLGISEVDFSYSSATRAFIYSATVQTAFGAVQTTFVPGNSATIPIAA